MISDNFPNKIDKHRHDITRTCKESLKPLTETDKEPTNYKESGYAVSEWQTGAKYKLFKARHL